MYQRIVCFKFKAGATEQDINQHMAMIGALQHEIPQIIMYSGGRVIETEESKLHYDTTHFLTFSAKEDIDRYFRYEAHTRFIEANRENWERVLVLDAEIEKGL